jgi:hypothetical protein
MNWLCHWRLYRVLKRRPYSPPGQSSLWMDWQCAKMPENLDFKQWRNCFREKHVVFWCWTWAWLTSPEPKLKRHYLKLGVFFFNVKSSCEICIKWIKRVYVNSQPWIITPEAIEIMRFCRAPFRCKQKQTLVRLTCTNKSSEGKKKCRNAPIVISKITI